MVNLPKNNEVPAFINDDETYQQGSAAKASLHHFLPSIT